MNWLIVSLLNVLRLNGNPVTSLSCFVPSLTLSTVMWRTWRRSWMNWLTLLLKTSLSQRRISCSPSRSNTDKHYFTEPTVTNMSKHFTECLTYSRRDFWFNTGLTLLYWQFYTFLPVSLNLIYRVNAKCLGVGINPGTVLHLKSYMVWIEFTSRWRFGSTSLQCLPFLGHSCCFTVIFRFTHMLYILLYLTNMHPMLFQHQLQGC